MINIEFIQTHKVFFEKPLLGCYTFQPKGKLKFLQVWMWKALHLFGVIKQKHIWDYGIKKVEIDTIGLIDAILNQKRWLVSQFDLKSKYLIMGEEDFALLRKDKEIGEHLRFEMDVRFGTPEGVIMLGLKVVVVPWIKGMFVMPEIR